MRKKYRIASFLLAAISAVSLCSCDFSSAIEEEQASVGKNAYEIAVENGFKGTVEDWLLSLKGADGKDAKEITIDDIYDAWIEEGNSGSFNDFLKEYLSLSVGEQENTEIMHRCLTSSVSIFNVSDYQTTISEGGFFSESKTVDYKKISAGSGVIVDIDKDTGNAYVLTNFHVVYAAGSREKNYISDELILYTYGCYPTLDATYEEVTVGNTKKDYLKVVDGGESAVYAEFIAGSLNYDIALLKVTGSAVLRDGIATAATFAEFNDLTVGEKTFVIGNPKGDGISVTSGILSVDSEESEMTGADDKTKVTFRLMRTDAAINRGNSGGGVFNAQGDLIGIVNSKNVESDVDNMGYALPIFQIDAVMRNMLDNDGVLYRATLGIMVGTKSSYARWNESLKKTEIIETIQVGEVLSDGIAYGKLQTGDTIKSISLGGRTVETTRKYLFTEEMYNLRKGDTLSVTVLREGVEHTYSFTFENDKDFTVIA